MKVSFLKYRTKSCSLTAVWTLEVIAGCRISLLDPVHDTMTSSPTLRRTWPVFPKGAMKVFLALWMNTGCG